MEHRGRFRAGAFADSPLLPVLPPLPPFEKPFEKPVIKLDSERKKTVLSSDRYRDIIVFKIGLFPLPVDRNVTLLFISGRFHV